MSLQQALEFLQSARVNPSVREVIEKGQEDLGPQDLVGLGASIGLEFSVNELNEAFRHHWAICSLTKE